ncbi:unnamed protein product, partial [Musa banksii]
GSHDSPLLSGSPFHGVAQEEGEEELSLFFSRDSKSQEEEFGGFCLGLPCWC